MNNTKLREKKKKAFALYLNKYYAIKSDLDKEYERLNELDSILLTMSDHSKYNINQFTNIIKEKNNIFQRIKFLESCIKRRPNPITMFFKILKTK